MAMAAKRSIAALHALFIWHMLRMFAHPTNNLFLNIRTAFNLLLYLCKYFLNYELFSLMNKTVSIQMWIQKWFNWSSTIHVLGNTSRLFHFLSIFVKHRWHRIQSKFYFHVCNNNFLIVKFNSQSKTKYRSFSKNWREMTPLFSSE